MKKLIFVAMSSLLSYQIGAWEIDVEVDAKTTTPVADCQKYADNICELVALFVKADTDDKKRLIEESVKAVKKSLRRCEKNNKPRKQISNIKIGVGHDFNK